MDASGIQNFPDIGYCLTITFLKFAHDLTGAINNPVTLVLTRSLMTDQISTIGAWQLY